MNKTKTILLSFPILLTGCTKDASSDRAWRRTFPIVAVTSPTAFKESDPAKTNDWAQVSAGFNIPFIKTIVEWLSKPGATEDLPAAELPLRHALRNYSRFVDSNPYESAVQLDLNDQTVERPRCFGAPMEFNGKAIPAGNLGILAATEPPGTGLQACAAAQMNYLVQLAGTANSAVRLVTMLHAGMRAHRFPVPAMGESVDAIGAIPPLGKNITLSRASLTHRKGTVGESLFDTHVEFTNKDHRGWLRNFHIPLSEDGSRFRGIVKMVLPIEQKDGDGATAFRGMAMTYEGDGSRLTYILEMASNGSTISQDFFQKGSHRIQFSNSAFGEEGYRFLASFDSNTNAGVMKIAWMDHSIDTASRVFEVKVSKESNGVLSGFAYFGFGDSLPQLNDTSIHWIRKFIPQPGEGEAIEGKCQGQKFSQMTIDGPFLSKEFHGPFLPTNTGMGSGVVSGNFDLNGTITIQSLDLIEPGLYGRVEIACPKVDLPSELAS